MEVLLSEELGQILKETRPAWCSCRWFGSSQSGGVPAGDG